MVEREEGRYTDPFERHEARWMSDGTPTKLVRDAGVESCDDPPDEEPSHTPTRVQEVQAANGSDPLRAGDSEGGGQSRNERMAEAGQFGATWGSHIPLSNPREDEEQRQPAASASVPSPGPILTPSGELDIDRGRA